MTISKMYGTAVDLFHENSLLLFLPFVIIELAAADRVIDRAGSILQDIAGNHGNIHLSLMALETQDPYSVGKVIFTEYACPRRCFVPLEVIENQRTFGRPCNGAELAISSKARNTVRDRNTV